jgi:hypothetical protein
MGDQPAAQDRKNNAPLKDFVRVAARTYARKPRLKAKEIALIHDDASTHPTALGGSQRGMNVKVFANAPPPRRRAKWPTRRGGGPSQMRHTKRLGEHPAALRASCVGR